MSLSSAVNKNNNKCNVILTAVTCGLYPQLCKVIRPPQRFVEVSIYIDNIMCQFVYCNIYTYIFHTYIYSYVFSCIRLYIHIYICLYVSRTIRLYAYALYILIYIIYVCTDPRWQHRERA